jgi:hypothetical protein
MAFWLLEYIYIFIKGKRRASPWEKDSYFLGSGAVKRIFRREPCPEDVLLSRCVHSSPNRPETLKVLGNFCVQSTNLSKSLGVHKLKLMRKQKGGPRTAFIEYCFEGAFLDE